MEVRIVNPIEDINVLESAESTTINLFENFDDPFTTGLVARFELDDDTIGSGGVTEVLLFDQQGEGAPNSVANFLNYVNDGDYIDSIIHRSVPGFVVQGGGFVVEGLEEALNDETPDDGTEAVELVPTDPPIANEFSEERSNVRGTIAFARLGGDPDSATSQWFFNLADNSANLDTQNGGFTVFGQVLGEEDLETIDAIADLAVVNATPLFPGFPFAELPVNDNDEEVTLEDIEDDEDLVRYSSIEVEEVEELEFEIVANSNPDLVDADINDAGELILDYEEGETGTADITVSATNLVGDTLEETFSATVAEDVDETDASLAIASEENNILTVEGDEGASLNVGFTPTTINSDRVNEIGVYSVGDTEGAIGEVSPGDEEYLDLALSGGQTLFSVLASEGDEGITLENIERIISATSDQLLAFYFVEDGTADAVLNEEIPPENVRFGLDEGVLAFGDLDDGEIELNFFDGEVIVTAEETAATEPTGSDLQGIVQGELFDLRDIEEEVTVTLAQDVASIADFDNLVTLYEVDNVQGAVEDLLPGQEGYAEAALGRVVNDFLLRGGSQSNTTVDEFGEVTLNGGSIYAPVIIANGGDASVEDFLATNPDNTVGEVNDPVAYFTFLGANPDGETDHIRLLGDNTFGFEDLPNGGDRDFNDFVFEVEFA